MRSKDDVAAELAVWAWQARTAGDGAAAVVLAALAVAAARGRTRPERQRAQIVELAVAGDAVRATGLSAEHLAEFPDDALVREVLSRIYGGDGVSGALPGLYE
jgi:hypothetical protein